MTNVSLPIPACANGAPCVGHPCAAHRLDADLEMCVCVKCGQAWVQDLSSFTRLEDALARLRLAMSNLTAAQVKMAESFQRIADSLSKIRA